MTKITKALYLVVGILIISQFYSLSQVTNLKKQLQQTENQIYSAEERLSNRIQTIYSEVDRKLTEQASLVAFCNYEIGEFNLETLTVPITFKLQPKALTDTTLVSLKFDNESVPMDRVGTEFVLTKNFKVQEELSPTIVVMDKDVEQFEKNSALEIYNLVDSVFNNVRIRFGGESGYNAQPPYYYNMKGEIRAQETFAGANQYYKDAKYIVTLDDEIIKTYDIEDLEGGRLEVDDKFAMEKGQVLMGKFIATDKRNITYEHKVFSHICGLERQREPYYDDLSITAPDGTVIYEFDEKN